MDGLEPERGLAQPEKPLTAKSVHQDLERKEGPPLRRVEGRAREPLPASSFCARREFPPDGSPESVRSWQNSLP